MLCNEIYDAFVFLPATQLLLCKSGKEILRFLPPLLRHQVEPSLEVKIIIRGLLKCHNLTPSGGTELSLLPLQGLPRPESRENGEKNHSSARDKSDEQERKIDYEKL
jgi:hypothetical protein